MASAAAEAAEKPDFRLFDLYMDRGMITSQRVRDLITYYERYHRFDSEWEWQYRFNGKEWKPMPRRVLRMMWERRRKELGKQLDLAAAWRQRGAASA